MRLFNKLLTMAGDNIPDNNVGSTYWNELVEETPWISWGLPFIGGIILGVICGVLITVIYNGIKAQKNTYSKNKTEEQEEDEK